MHDALRVYPGRGVIPLDRIRGSLKDIGYKGGFSVEIFRPEYWRRNPLMVARQAKTAALAALKQAGWE
jgi:2-keto-myo-inositol isomerase